MSVFKTFFYFLCCLWNQRSLLIIAAVPLAATAVECQGYANMNRTKGGPLSASSFPLLIRYPTHDNLSVVLKNFDSFLACMIIPELARRIIDNTPWPMGIPLSPSGARDPPEGHLRHPLLRIPSVLRGVFAFPFGGVPSLLDYRIHHKLIQCTPFCPLPRLDPHFHLH